MISSFGDQKIFSLDQILRELDGLRNSSNPIRLFKFHHFETINSVFEFESSSLSWGAHTQSANGYSRPTLLIFSTSDCFEVENGTSVMAVAETFF